MEKWRDVFKDKVFRFFVGLLISIIISFKLLFFFHTMKPRKNFETLPKKSVTKVSNDRYR
jgi:hypothetical protein